MSPEARLIWGGLDGFDMWGDGGAHVVDVALEMSGQGSAEGRLSSAGRTMEEISPPIWDAAICEEMPPI